MSMQKQLDNPIVQIEKLGPRSGFSCLYASLDSELDLGQYQSLPHRVLESHWFVWITQMNHIPKEIGYEKHRDWASSQVGPGEPSWGTCQLGSHALGGIGPC